MKKILTLALAMIMAMSFAACGRKNDLPTTAGEQVDNAASQPSQSQNATPALTEEEQTMVGLWESDAGNILAIKARTGRNEMSDQDFVFDAILYDPNADEWFKFTREDGCFFEKREGISVLGDDHLCPTNEEQTNWQMTSQRLAYDLQTDTMTYTYLIDEQIVEPMTIVFHRTDKDVDSADWDWYYEIHPERK